MRRGGAVHGGRRACFCRARAHALPRARGALQLSPPLAARLPISEAYAGRYQASPLTFASCITWFVKQHIQTQGSLCGVEIADRSQTPLATAAGEEHSNSWPPRGAAGPLAHRNRLNRHAVGGRAYRYGGMEAVSSGFAARSAALRRDGCRGALLPPLLCARKHLFAAVPSSHQKTCTTTINTARNNSSSSRSQEGGKQATMDSSRRDSRIPRPTSSGGSTGRAFGSDRVSAA